jgi:hypothetical protein
LVWFLHCFLEFQSLKLRTAESNCTLNFISNYLFLWPFLTAAFELLLILICYFLISPITEQKPWRCWISFQTFLYSDVINQYLRAVLTVNAQFINYFIHSWWFL